MKREFFFWAILLSLNSLAQKNTLRSATTVQGGLLEGATGSAFQLKAVQGFRWQTWVAGIGAGLDYYHTRSLPLFLDIQKKIGHNEKAPFVYVSGGYHFPWLKEQDKEGNGLTAKGGLYCDAGIGYQLLLAKKATLFFTGGYSQKNFSETQTNPVWIAIWPAPQPQTTRFDFQLRRLSIQTGVRF